MRLSSSYRKHCVDLTERFDILREAADTKRSEYHTQIAKMSFDEIFDLTAGVFLFS